MILHTVNKSPAHDQTLRDCLSLALPGSGILLLEDGAYAAVETLPNRELLEGQQSYHTWYVLEADLQARGLSKRILPWFEKISYPRFVDLCVAFSKVQNWY